MRTFAVHQLRVTCEAETRILLNEHKGSAIRGALFQALRGPQVPRGAWAGFCANKQAPHCSLCPVSNICPVMHLVSTLHEDRHFGRDAPRPYVINPPLDLWKLEYEPGERFCFDLILVGEAAQLFPYVVLALERLAYDGLGKRQPQQDGRYRRGRARILAMDAVHPLRGEVAPVLREGERNVQVPSLPVKHRDVSAAAKRLRRSGQLTLRFLTPARIVERGALLKEMRFRPLMQRLLERLKELVEHFSSSKVPYDIKALRDMAEGVKLVADRTEWVELRGYSTRLGREQQLGGLMGEATFECEDWSPFLPWLIWGTIVHVGKNAVKGDGWFEIVSD